MAYLVRNSRLSGILGVLLIGLVLGVSASYPTALIGGGVALGAAFLVATRLRTVPYAPLFVPALLAVSVEAAGVAMWLSVLILMAIATVQILKHRDFHLKSPMTSICVWWLVFLVVRLVSTITSPYQDVALDNTFAYLRVLTIFIAAYFAVRPANVNAFVVHSLLASTILAGLLMFFYWRYYGGFNWSLFDRDMKFTLWQQGVNLNVITYLLGFVAAPGAALLMESKGWLKRSAIAAALVAVVVSVFFSSSRASQLFVLTQMGLFLLWPLMRRHPRNAVRWIIGIGTMVFCAGLLIYEGAIDGVVGTRDLLREISWEKFLEAPIVGWGPGTYKVGLERYVLLDELRRVTGLGEDLAGQAHNFLMNNLPEIGIIGLFVIIGFFAVVVSQVLRRSTQLSAMSVAMFVVVFSMPIRGLFETSGLFGGGDGLADLLSWVWVAVALRTLERDEGVRD